MNRIVRGAVVLVASGLALGCNTEPDEMIGGDPTSIVADPGIIFVAQGDSQAVLVRLIDQQGTALESPITVTGATGPVAVSVDSQFRPVFGADGVLRANTQNTELRIFVRGAALGAQVLTITAGGITQTLPVTVTPTQITTTVSNATPGIGEAVTITAEPGLTFTRDSRVVSATGAIIGYPIAIAPDGTSMTVVFEPGTGPEIRITNVVPSYAPALSLTLASTATVATTTTVVGLAGVGSTATAPSLVPVSADHGSGVIDAGTTYPGAPSAGGHGVRYYKLVVEETAEYDFTLTFAGGKDLGLYFYTEAGVLIGTFQADDFGSGAAASPEHVAHELDAGTYFLGVVGYTAAYPTPPASLTITIEPVH